MHTAPAMTVNGIRSKKQSSTVPDQQSDNLARYLSLVLLDDMSNSLETLSHLTYLAHLESERSEKVRKYMSLAEEHVQTLGHLVTKSSGFVTLDEVRAPLDLAALSEQALSAHQRAIRSKRIHLVKDFTGVPVANVHQRQMLGAVSGILANALEALPERGTLSLRIRKASDGIRIVVADNGHGVSPFDFPRIFEAFFTTRTQPGRGLGLTLARRVIERHGGKIRFRSSIDPKRQGTAFCVTLPAHEA